MPSLILTLTLTLTLTQTLTQTLTLTQSIQDRLGFHTFRRGDCVEFLQCEPGELSPMVAVFGVLNLEAEGNTQARKFLVLYEVQAKLFFVGSWPQWRRLRNPEGTFSTFDCDNGEHVKTLNYEETHAMCNEFSELSDVWFRGHRPRGAARRVGPAAVAEGGTPEGGAAGAEGAPGGAQGAAQAGEDRRRQGRRRQGQGGSSWSWS